MLRVGETVHRVGETVLPTWRQLWYQLKTGTVPVFNQNIFEKNEQAEVLSMILNYHPVKYHFSLHPPFKSSNEKCRPGSHDSVQ